MCTGMNSTLLKVDHFSHAVGSPSLSCGQYLQFQVFVWNESETSRLLAAYLVLLESEKYVQGAKLNTIYLCFPFQSPNVQLFGTGQEELQGGRT